MEHLDKSTITVLIVKVDAEIYSIRTEQIQEVVPMMAVTRFPDAPSFLEGFIDIRGDLYAIVDLRKRFGYPRKDYLRANRIVLVRYANRNLGLIVDEVRPVEEWTAQRYQAGVLAERTSHFTGIIGKTNEGESAQMIDPCHILTADELQLLAERK